MNKRTLLILWLLAWVALFVTYSGYFKLGTGSEIGLFFLIVLLTFPSGLLLFFILWALGRFDIPVLDHPAIPYLILAVFIGIGYMQWFVLFPRLFGPNKSLNTDTPKDGAPVS
jgi:hypothetical protein